MNQERSNSIRLFCTRQASLFMKLVGEQVDATMLHRCEAEGCKADTTGGVHLHGIHPHYWHLCEAHRTPDAVGALLEQAEYP